MKKKAFKKISRFGLDIGNSLIKAVEVSSDATQKTLIKADSLDVEFPPNQGKIKDALKALLDRFKPSAKDVNISLSAPNSIVRFINMPKMKEADLKNSLRFEAEKYIPFNINEVVLDSVILDEPQELKNQMRVLLAAAKKQEINTRIEMLKEFGLSVTIIDIDSFACFNAFSNSIEKSDASKSVAILNIGYSQTNVIIAMGEKPLFTRDILIGSKDIVHSVSKMLQVEEKEANRLVYEPKEKGAEVSEAIKGVLGDLINELRLSFGYYENQYGKGVNEIYISGGVAKIGSVPEYFEENLGMKPILWDPLSKITVSPDLDAKKIETLKPQLAVCTGLAIRG